VPTGARRCCTKGGEFDLIAVGRAVLQDPEWALKIKAGSHHELRDYDAKSLQTYF
jgi:2,4-dienoyl-CoA reductase-like NADH-dependent reductase (Old Yellow Enzyme family)